MIFNRKKYIVILMLVKFLLRWLLSSLGLWVAAAVLGPERMSLGDSLINVIAAGFFFAGVNILLKPITIFLSLPALLLSLGLFMLIINGLMVYIAASIYGPFFVSSFWVAVIAGVIVGLVNYLMSQLLEEF